MERIVRSEKVWRLISMKQVFLFPRLHFFLMSNFNFIKTNDFEMGTTSAIVMVSLWDIHLLALEAQGWKAVLC